MRKNELSVRIMRAALLVSIVAVSPTVMGDGDYRSPTERKVALAKSTAEPNQQATQRGKESKAAAAARVANPRASGDYLDPRARPSRVAGDQR